MVLNSVEGDVERLMRDGQSAAKRGDKVMARALLTQLLEADPHNEKAWMWLSGVVADPTEQQTCLENVLIINPNNAQARKGLEYISNKTGLLPRVSPAQAEGVPTERSEVAGTQQLEEQAEAAPAFPDATMFGLSPFEVPSVAGMGGFAGFGDLGAVEGLQSAAYEQPQREAQSEPWKAEDHTSPLTDVPGLTDFMLPARDSGQLPPWEQERNEPDAGDSYVPWNGTDNAAATAAFGAEFGTGGLFAGRTPPVEEAMQGAMPTAETVDVALPNDVAPFEMPETATTFAGPMGAPTLGLSGDLDNELPEWMRGISSAATHDNAPVMDESQGAVHVAPQFEAHQAMEPVQEAAGDASAAPQAELPPTFNDGLSSWLDKVGGDSNVAFGGFAAAGAEAPQQEHADGTHAASGDPFAGNASLNADPFASNGHADPFAVNAEEPGGPFGAATSNQADPFTASGSFDMGPFTANHLPAPEELPGGHSESGNAAQPWYLQGSSETRDEAQHYMGGSGYDHMGAGGYDHDAPVVPATPAGPVAVIPCPNCHQKVPETSLACSECSYSFFVHCPHCHELVDTSGARPGVNEPCPYCGGEINKMDMGLINIKGVMLVPRPEGDKKETMSWGVSSVPEVRGGVAVVFGWVVDLMWLFAVVLMVWALTQLPTWLNLTDLYS